MINHIRLGNYRVTSEGSHPTFQVDLDAAQVREMFLSGAIAIDPSYQRGRVASGKIIHALPRSQEHIRGIIKDLRDQKAILPPIWMNCRDATGLYRGITSPVDYLWLTNSQLFVIDGWHRTLAIVNAQEDNLILASRCFTFYIMQAPISEEARVFRILNSAALPVQKNRVAWVSSPYSGDWMQVAYEFVTSCKQFTKGDTFNFDPVSSNLSGSSPLLCSYLAIATGFSNGPWADSGLDPTHRDTSMQVVKYMLDYWNALYNVLPALGFRTKEERARDKAESRVLISRNCIQSLVMLGYYLLAEMPGTTIKEKLKAAVKSSSSTSREIAFSRLKPLGKKNFFSVENPRWKNMVLKGKLQNGLVHQKALYSILTSELGSFKNISEAGRRRESVKARSIASR